MRLLRWRRILLPAAVALAAMAPVTYHPGRGIVPAEACADGTCCAEEKSLCFINGVKTENAYKKDGAGPCGLQS